MSAPSTSLNRPSRRKLAASVAAILALSGSAAVHATTWFVNDCTDDTANGHFRWAANGAVSGDIIDLTTQLTPAGYPNCTNAALNGFNHTLVVSSTVTLAGGVTIQGPGIGELAISAVGLNASVIHSNGNLTLNDLGVKYGGGNAPRAGACIYAHNNITLSNVRAYHCYAYSSVSSSRGGGVYSFLGSVSMTGSTVDKSQAAATTGTSRGGGVYGFSGVTLTNSTISNSTATSQTGSAEGGGVFNFGSGGGALSMVGSNISGTASVTGTTGGHAYGGAAESRTTATADNFTFVEGTATTQSAGNARGGGIYSIGNAYVTNSSNVWISSAYSKSGSSHGGAVYTKGNATVNYSSIQVSSAQRGGGVYSNNGLTMKYSLVYQNNATFGGGGAINKTAGSSFVRGSVVWKNGGGGYSGLDLFAGAGTSVTIENSTITGNTATGNNAALYLKAYHTTLDNSTIAYNTSGFGSAVYVTGGNAGSTFDMNSTLLASNPSGSGRNDLFVSSSSPFTGTSSNNFVRDPGSGVPGGTIVGQCPLLHPIKQDFSAGGGWWNRWSIRPTMKSPEIDTGSNPLGLGSDQRGGGLFATTPPRASGPGPANASPIPDIGAFEVDQDDIIFDSIFETCQ